MQAAMYGGLLALLFACQFTLTPDPPGVLADSITLIMVAGAALAAVISLCTHGAALHELAPDDSAASESPPMPVLRVGWVLLAVALSGAAALVGVHAPRALDAGGLLMLWGLALAALVRSAHHPSTANARSRAAPLRRWEVWLLLGLFGAGLFVRGVHIDVQPALLDEDEIRFGLNGVGVRENEFMVNPFAPGDHTHPYLNYVLTGVTTGLLGVTPLAARLPSVIMGALNIPLMYLIGRELMGWRLGLPAAAFALTWAFHVQFSRLALNQAADALFAMLPFYFFLRGLRRNVAIDYVLCGIALGAAQLFYAGGRMAPLILIAYAGYLWLRQRRAMAGRQRLIGIALLALAITALPQHYFLAYHRLPLTDRTGPSLIAGGHLLAYQGTDKDVIDLLAQQAHRAFLALFYVRDYIGWYGTTSNLMGPLGGPPLLIGAGVGLAMLWRRPKLALPAGWVLAVIVLLSMLATMPPQYQRYFPASASLALLVGLGVVAASGAVAAMLHRPRLRETLIIGAATMLAAGNLWYYADVYVAGGGHHPNRVNQVSNLLGRAMASAYDSGRQVVMMVGYRTGVENLGIVKYLMVGRPYIVVEDNQALEDAAEILERAVNPPGQSARPFAFFIAPSRAHELGALRARYPGGVLSLAILPDLSLLFYQYASP